VTAPNTARYVRIANLTRDTTVAERCRVASSTRDRTVGLLGTKELRRGEGLLIERSPSIHMFFMRYAIDVLFIDRHLRVTRLVRDLRPWRIVGWARGARDCIELPTGTIARTQTAIGDQLAVLRIDDPVP
jgi:uncharacterized membrane protein (UPF0127 family)